MQDVGPDMVVDRVNDLDQPIGQLRRKDLLDARANFRVVHAFLFDTQGHLLIQQIGTNRSRHPGMWGSSVAGYVFAGETYNDAIQRRLKQELHLNVPLCAHGKIIVNDTHSKKFTALFVGTRNAPVTFDKHHIASVDWLSLDEIDRQQTSGQRRFTPTFLALLQHFQQTRP